MQFLGNISGYYVSLLRLCFEIPLSKLCHRLRRGCGVGTRPYQTAH